MVESIGLCYFAKSGIVGKGNVLDVRGHLTVVTDKHAKGAMAMGKMADFSPWGSVLVLFASGVLAFGLAVFLFSWDSHNTTRRGHPLMALLVLLPYALEIFLLS